MRLNYIILAHKNPLQLKRLVQKLYEPEINFFIHVDRNINITPFKKILKEFQNVIFLENNDRYPGTWGDIGIVNGTISAMRKIVKNKEKGYTILLSGQDYPLRNNKNILAFFEKDEKNFINITPIKILWKKHGLDRIEKYKINKSDKRGHFLLLPSIFDRDFYNYRTLGQLNYLRKTQNYKILLKVFVKRQFPDKLEPFGGSQWWALKNTTSRSILQFIDEYPDYLKYHNYSLLPDEIFFQSVISYLNSLEPLGISNSITYVNWERKSGPLPVTFETSDFAEIKKAAEKHLFARKFDIYKNSEILDTIDLELLS